MDFRKYLDDMEWFIRYFALHMKGMIFPWGVPGLDDLRALGWLLDEMLKNGMKNTIKFGEGGVSIGLEGGLIKGTGPWRPGEKTTPTPIGPKPPKEGSRPLPQTPGIDGGPPTAAPDCHNETIRNLPEIEVNGSGLDPDGESDSGWTKNALNKLLTAISPNYANDIPKGCFLNIKYPSSRASQSAAYAELTVDCCRGSCNDDYYRCDAPPGVEQVATTVDGVPQFSRKCQCLH